MKGTRTRAKRSTAGRGLFLTRDSGGMHETTPGQYVRWAQLEAARLGVSFNGTPEQIDDMIREGRFQEGDLFLDYGVDRQQAKPAGPECHDARRPRRTPAFRTYSFRGAIGSHGRTTPWMR